MDKKGIYLGPRLRRIRRDLGLTQAEMAADLEISSSYVALMEGNQRPVTAGTLLQMAKTYKIDFSEFEGGSGADLIARLQAVIRDPILTDIEFGSLDTADVAHSFPGFAEALLRLHSTYKEAQLALADRRQSGGDGQLALTDPVTPVRNFLASRNNCFPTLDIAAERLSGVVAEAGGLAAYVQSQHGLRVRRLPAEVMVGSVRRLDRHRGDLLLDETLSASSRDFQIAQQISYIEFDGEIANTIAEARIKNDDARRLAHRALAAYCAAAILMPYTAFSKAVDRLRYDVESIARQFGTSFEQTAHRLTTLQKPGQERIPFFFIRVDVAGNVSKRLNSGSFPFARHGGGCPLWTVHQVFATPATIVTQWLELPDGQRFFSIARTSTSGGGGHNVPRVTRAVALVCEAQHADRLIYAKDHPQASSPTPIGIGCRLCHRTACTSRSEPPIGRHILADNYRKTEAPFGFSDA